MQSKQQVWHMGIVPSEKKTDLESMLVTLCPFCQNKNQTSQMGETLQSEEKYLGFDVICVESDEDVY